MILSIKIYEDQLKELKEILLKLPRGYHSTANLVLGLLSSISVSEQTKMTSSDLAPIFASWFIRPPFHIFYRENDQVEEIMEYLIFEYDYLFKNMPLKRQNKNTLNNSSSSNIYDTNKGNYSSLQAPQMPRLESIRFQDISSMNQNRKPVYYLQQIKDYQESLVSLNNDGNNTNDDYHENSIQNSINDDNDDNDLLNVDDDGVEEEDAEEEEFNEEESRKTDEMMGVIDGPSELLQDDIVEETTLELEGIAEGSLEHDNMIKEEAINDIASNSIVLLPSHSPRHNSQPMLYQTQKTEEDDGFELVDDDDTEPKDSFENFEDVSVSLVHENKQKPDEE